MQKCQWMLIHIFIHVCMLYMYMRVCAHGDQRPSLHMETRNAIHCIWDRVSHCPGAHQLGKTNWPVTVSSSFTCLWARIIGSWPSRVILHVFWGLNTAPHTFKTRALLNKPPQPPNSSQNSHLRVFKKYPFPFIICHTPFLSWFSIAGRDLLLRRHRQGHGQTLCKH